MLHTSPTIAAALIGAFALCLGSVAHTQEWEPIQCPPADRDAAERFETVELLDDFATGTGEWRAHAGGQQAKSALARDEKTKHSGAASLRVDFQFVGNRDYEYVDFGRPIEVAETGLGVGFWVKGDGTPLRLRARLYDKSGECHQVDLAAASSTEWQYVACAFDIAGGWWGGDANKRLDYPCTLRSILSDRPSREFAGKGSFWVDEVALVRPRKVEEKLTIEVDGKRLGNVYEPGDSVRLRLSGPGDEIRWRAEDYWGEELAKGSGKPDATEVTVALPKPGFYVFALDRVVRNTAVESRLFRCAAIRPADPAARNDFVGIGCHFRGNAYPLECMDLLKRLGITHFRDEVSWGSAEPEKGKLSMPDYGKQFTDHARELGLQPLLIFDYANQHYDGGGFPDSEEAIDGYARYCAELAKWTKDSVDTFEVWNEYSIGCGMGGKKGQAAEQYARMIDAAYKAVKKARPDCTIVGIGGEHSAHHVDFIEGMLKSGANKNMEAFSVHSYRYPRAPEESGLFEEIRNVANLVKRNGGPGGHCWVTEIGWPTFIGSRGVDERTQAQYFVRTMALLQATGVCDRVYWYDLKNDGTQREYNEHNFGVIWHQTYNLAPKPAAVAMTVFARVTAGAKDARLWNEGDAYGVFYRQGDGSDLVVAWSAGKPTQVELKGEAEAIADLMGNGEDAPATVTLTGDPVYVGGRNLQLVPRTR